MLTSFSTKCSSRHLTWSAVWEVGHLLTSVRFPIVPARLLGAETQDPTLVALVALGSLAGLCSVLVPISNLIRPGSSAWQVVYPALAIHASQFIFIVLIKPQVIFQVRIVFPLLNLWPAY